MTRPSSRALRSLSTLLPAALLAALPAACARALPGGVLAPVDVLTEASPAASAPLGFEDALRRAVSDDPELASLRAGILGASGWPAAEPLGLAAGADSDGRAELGLEIDLLSVLGLGPRKAEQVLARLRSSEATIALTARTREVAGELAEAYAVSAALSAPPPEIVLLDAGAFVKAGVAPAATHAAGEAARATLAADGAARAAEMEASTLRVRRRLGLRPDAPLTLDASDAAFPVVPEPDARRLLAASPELMRRLAAYEVARGELLRAQSNRDPGLVLNPALALDPSQFFGAVQLRLPIGAGHEIRAAHARLEAARLSVRAAVLAALEEAALTRAAWQVAEGSAAAARSRLGATLALADAERGRVEAQGEGFTEAVLAGNAVIDAVREARQAVTEAARARVKAALAAGWPSALPSLPPAPACSVPAAPPGASPGRPPSPPVPDPRSTPR
jgi:hypothetical protein